jgi:hypothetical protein
MMVSRRGTAVGKLAAYEVALGCATRTLTRRRIRDNGTRRQERQGTSKRSICTSIEKGTLYGADTSDTALLIGCAITQKARASFAHEWLITHITTRRPGLEALWGRAGRTLRLAGL